MLRVVAEGWGGAPSSIATLSAKRALKARIAGDDELLDASGFRGLLSHLEAEIFSCSRVLKRRACASRLVAVLDRALELEKDAVDAASRRVAKEQARANRVRAAAEGLRSAMEDEVRRLDRELEQIFRAASHELLGGAALEAEERRLAWDALSRRAAAAIESTERRVIARARGVVGDALGAEPEPPEAAPAAAVEASLDLRVRACLSPALAGFGGYQRARLAHPGREGGRGDALGGLRAQARDQLLRPLRDGASELVAQVEGEGIARAEAASERAAALSDEVYAPLRALRHVLAEATRGESTTLAGSVAAPADGENR